MRERERGAEARAGGTGRKKRSNERASRRWLSVFGRSGLSAFFAIPNSRPHTDHDQHALDGIFRGRGARGWGGGHFGTIEEEGERRRTEHGEREANAFFSAFDRRTKKILKLASAVGEKRKRKRFFN